MRKPFIVFTLAIVAIIVSVWLVWYAFQPRQSQTDNSQNNSTNGQTNEQSGSDTGSESTSQAVTIQDFAFSPSSITVKKGTTVTWTNQDSTQHNVVADDEANSGGLPAEAELLSKGQTFSHTFDSVGTFSYHCGPHPNMKGTVEVVE